ncbi:Gfo/Idh/MocA family oxidoreductase [Oscillospiraceae bacterium MB08-C2-2]|nr:Gfo/Idh/MocA family oxidoreductase [Oscillospiraceae bacterium MB08-C2-2]
MVNLVIIGCGDVTEKRHGPLAARSQKVKLKGFYNRSPHKAEAFARKYGGKAYASLIQIWEDDAVDAVLVATPEESHAEIAVAALRAGKHVLCEKPLAASAEEAYRMLEAEKESGKILTIVNTQRLYPAHQWVKHQLDSGEVGRVVAFHSEYATGGLEVTASKEQQEDFYDRSGYTNGVLAQVGNHRIDLLHYLLGEKSSEVLLNAGSHVKTLANGSPIPYEDYAVLNLRYDSGVQGTIAVNWFHYGELRRESCIYGTEGTLVTYAGGADAVLYRKNGEKLAFSAPAAYKELYPEPLTPIIELFADSIAQGKKPFVLSEDGLYALAVQEAAYASLAAGGWIKVKTF